MNPTDCVGDRVRTKNARDVHSQGRGDQHADEIGVADGAMEGRIAIANAAGKLNGRGEKRDESRNAVEKDPVAYRSKVYPLRIGSVVEKKSLVVIEHEERADGDREVEQIFRGGEACSLQRRTFRATGFDSMSWPGSG